jgi:hypothetical protein
LRHNGCTAFFASVTPQQELLELVSQSGPPSIAPTAYDTSRRARAGRAEAPDQPAYPEALAWLLHHQRGDGTWGSGAGHHHDRVVSTLAAMGALAQWREVTGDPEGFTERLHTAAWGIAPHLAALGRDLCPLDDFAPVSAALAAEVRWRGLVLPFDGLKDSRDLRSMGQAVGAAGSVQLSTAFERAWMLHHVALAFPDYRATGGAWEQAVTALQVDLPQIVGQQVRDLAAVAVAFRVLNWAGRQPDPRPLLQAVGDTDPRWDGCDRPNPPVGAQAHLLAALRSAGPFEGATRKIVGLLARTAGDHYWIDGQHASPYHATALAVIGLGSELSLAQEAVAWIEETQRFDGSWGHYQTSTAEETALCVQALACHRRTGGNVRAGGIEAGARWLGSEGAALGANEPLWVGRSLFHPTRVVRSAVLSALVLADG